MTQHKPYNGHRNWNAWNVSLWINNQEELYRMARYWIAIARNRREAAKLILEELHESNVTSTPDGAPYSKTTIELALRGM